jgi:hypothetical protein
MKRGRRLRMMRAMPRRMDIRSEMPAGALARAGVIASLVLGGVIAVGLTALIGIFVFTALRS